MTIQLKSLEEAKDLTRVKFMLGDKIIGAGMVFDETDIRTVEDEFIGEELSDEEIQKVFNAIYDQTDPVIGINYDVIESEIDYILSERQEEL